MNFLSRQEIFDRSTAFLLKQGQPCVDRNGACFYRHPEDPKLRCAVGALIPDEYYDPDMDRRDIDIDDDDGAPDNSISSVFVRFGAALEKAGLRAADERFLCALQGAHDIEFVHNGIESWKQRLREIAASHELSAAVLETA